MVAGVCQGIVSLRARGGEVGYRSSQASTFIGLT